MTYGVRLQPPQKQDEIINAIWHLGKVSQQKTCKINHKQKNKRTNVSGKQKNGRPLVNSAQYSDGDIISIDSDVTRVIDNEDSDVTLVINDRSRVSTAQILGTSGLCKKSSVKNP